METIAKNKTKVLVLVLIFLFCAMVAIEGLAQGHGEDGRKPSGTAWQHLSLTYKIDETPKTELAKQINKLGREGWEMFSVGNIIESGTTTQTIFYFKKQL